MKYILIRPDLTELDITGDVLKGGNNITEIAFDLNDTLIPANVRLTMANNDGFYSPDVQIFRDYDINQLLVKITTDLDELLFFGVLADIEYNLNEATLKISNVISELLDKTVDSLSMTATPSEILLELLRQAQIVESLIDKAQFRKLNFIFSKLSDLETQYPAGGVNAGTATVDWSQLGAIQDGNSEPIFEFVSGKYVFKPRSTQKLVLNITETTPIIDIIKEIASITGLLVFTTRGLFTATLYPFDEKYLQTPAAISADSTEARSVKYKRPLLWRRSEVILPYFDGSVVAKTRMKASDIAFSNSAFLEDIFSAKPAEFDGLDGALYHENLDSAVNALRSILLLRAPARWHSEFNLSMATSEGVSLLNSIELFKPFRIQFVDHCTNGLPIETRILDDKVFMRIVGAAENYEYRDTVNTQIEDYEALGNQSLYPSQESDLAFSGLTVRQSTEFLHRNNRANPALLKLNGLLVLLNNTSKTMSITYTYSGGTSSVTLNPGEFIEITANDDRLASLTVTFITDCGNLSETYKNIKPLNLEPSDNLLLTNYCTALTTSTDGLISQVDI